MFRFTPRDMIRDLRHLLGDRYRHDAGGLALIKEILQNADDARAKKLVLAWCEAQPLRPGMNPLFGRPGILIVNDAPFEEGHERAFTSFSNSSKDSEVAQIGRFGIGRKSLFHWSEVIGYLGRGADGRERGGVLDPWAELRSDATWRDHRFPDWTLWSAAEAQLLRDKVTAALTGIGQTWFGIWLPSREATDERHIVDTVTTLQTLPTTESAMSKMARLMPQLASLREIEISRLGSERALLGTLARQGETLGRPIRPTARALRTGLIDGPTGVVDYVCSEEHQPIEELESLKLKRGWPEEPPEDFDDPSSKPTPAKAEPHGAVTVIWGPESPGPHRLSLSFAIFLPLSSARLSEERPLAANRSVDIYLHGYLFPDSGRQDIEGLHGHQGDDDQTTAGIRRAWNRSLWRHITLPQVPYALEGALQRLDANLTAEVLSGLQTTRWWEEERQHVLSRAQLVYGPACKAPFVVDGNRRILRVPRATSTDVGSALSEASRKVDGYELAWVDQGGLLRSRESDSWGRNDVLLLREWLDPEIERAPMVWLPWAIGWLGSTFQPNAATSITEFVLLLWRAAMRGRDWAGKLKHAGWKALADYAGRQRLAVLYVEPSVVEMTRELRHAQTPLFESWPVLLVLRGDEKRESGALTPEVAMTALEAAAERIGDTTPEPKLTTFIATVLGTTSLAELKGQPGFSRLRVLKVWSSRGTGEGGLASLEKIDELSRRGLVFRRSGALQPENLGNALAGSVEGRPEVLLVDEDVIAEALELPKLGLDTLASAVSRNRVGGDLGSRVKLLDRMFRPRSGGAIDPSQASTEVINAMRRLLGGDAAPQSVANVIWMVSGFPTSLASALFPQSWQVLAPEVEEFVRRTLSQDWKDKLGLRFLNLSTLGAELERHLRGGTIQQVYGRLGDAGRHDLADCAAPLPTLWMQLEVHRDQRTGGWTALERDTSFIDTGLPVPRGILRALRVIRRRGVEEYDQALERAIEPLDAVRLVVLGLDEQNWEVVVEGLTRLGGGPGEQLLQRFRGTPWLPLEDGTRVAPTHVLRLPTRLAEAIARLPHRPSELRLAHEVSSVVRSHESWPAIELHLLSGAQAIQKFVEAIIGLDEVRKMDLRYLGEGADLPSALREHLAGDSVYDWWAALAEEGFSPSAESQDLVRGPLSKSRAHALLGVAPSVLAGERIKKAEINWFAHILGQLAHQGTVSSDDLKGRLLPDAELRLRPSSMLARGTEALPPHHRVHPDLEDFFEVAPVEDETVNTATDRTTLEAWLAPWDDAKTSQSLLAYFVSIFACNPANGLSALMRRLAPQDSAEGLVRNLIAYCHDSEGGEIARAKRTNFRFVRVRSGERYSVIALDFSVFHTAYNESETLFIDPMDLPRVAGREGEAARVIRLRELQSVLEPPRRHRLLEQAIIGLVQAVLGRRPKEALQRLLQKQAQELNQLLVAQNLLIDTLPSALRGLRVHKSYPELKTGLDAIENARHQLETKRNQLKDSPFQRDLRPFEDAFDDARRQLRSLVENDAKLGNSILAALRNKLAEYQYQPEQVLFELAQNADDAYAQRRVAAEGATGCPIEVEVKEHPTRVFFRHRGRPINRCYLDSDRDKGWERDLFNMLGLGFSEKGDEETGRFGLGFKSVYLVTDRPIVRSENAAFEIRAGVLPFAKNVSNEGWNGGTEFTLTLRDDVSWQSVVERFVRLSGLLTILAQDIDQVVLKTPGCEQVFGERPHVIARDIDSEVELLCLDIPRVFPNHGLGAPKLDVSGRWLFFRAAVDGDLATGPRLAIGFKVGTAGFEVANEVPSHWVTVPTRETRRLGFVVAGGFGIDVGRSRLADESEATRSVEKRLASMARAGLVLFETEILERWGDMHAVLVGSEGQLSDSSLATSLFLLLTRSFANKQDTMEQEQVRLILRPPMLDQVALLPDVEGHRRRFKDIEVVLDSDLGVRAVREVMREHFGLLGVAISEEQRNLLGHLGYFPRTRSLTVMEILMTALPTGSSLSVQAAEKLLALRAVQSVLRDSRTWIKVQEHVETLTVSNRVNGRIPIREVLVATSPKGLSNEEMRVAAFAPSERILHEEAGELVQECIFAFRRKTAFSRDDVFHWARMASTPAQQEGVAEYLFLGDEKDRLTDVLRIDRPSWLTPDLVADIGAEIGIDGARKDAMVVLLHGRQTAFRHWDIGLEDVTTEPQNHETRILTVERIMEWWAKDSVTHETRYQKWVYPAPWDDGRLFSSALKNRDPHAWGTIFTLAICQRIGRVRPQQNRDFIANHKAWISVLASPTSNPNEWIQLIDDWAEQNWTGEEYSHWLGLFPSLRRLWHGMDSLIEVLHTPPPSGTSATMLASFATNPALSGSGLRLPNLGRGFGKKGRVWLARELVRLGVWPLSAKMDYYVPWKLACELVLGRESGSEAELADMLRKKSGQEAPFGRCFDLPFDILRHDARTRASLMVTGADVEEWTIDDNEWGEP
jgi:hypothetical protein